MFGMIPKRNPANPWQTPPFNPAQQPQESPVSAARQPMAPEPQRGGFFAPGGTGRAIAGYMGDFLLQQAEMQPIYQPQMQMQQAMAAKQREASLKRDTDMQDWLAKQQWERANPNPDAFDRALQGAGIDPKSEQGQQLYRQRADALARDPMDEFVVVPIPGRGTYAGPRSGLSDVFRQQAPAVEITEEMWNSGKPVGGGGGNVTSNFLHGL